MTCVERYNLAQGMCMPGFVEKMAWQTLCYGKMNIDSTRESERCWFSDMSRLFPISTYNRNIHIMQ